MLDTRLASALLQAVPARAHLLLVGDTDQLPSVGAGNVLQDLITASRAPVTRLSVIFRQKGQSGIVTAAHAINSGDTSLPPASPSVEAIYASNDLTFVVADSAEDCLRKVIELCTRFIPQNYEGCDPIGEVQVMAPMHKGVAGVGNLNLQLQGALNPRGRALKPPAGEFRSGDKVIQLNHNYDKSLFNGDIGAITAVDPEAGLIRASFDGEKHEFTRVEMGDLALAYTISIHKSQGSEYPVVIVPLLKGHFMMQQRNLGSIPPSRGALPEKGVHRRGSLPPMRWLSRNGESKLQPRDAPQGKTRGGGGSRIAPAGLTRTACAARRDYFPSLRRALLILSRSQTAESYSGPSHPSHSRPSSELGSLRQSEHVVEGLRCRRRQSSGGPARSPATHRG